MNPIGEFVEVSKNIKFQRESEDKINFYLRNFNILWDLDGESEWNLVCIVEKIEGFYEIKWVASREGALRKDTGTARYGVNSEEAIHFATILQLAISEVKSREY